MITWLLLGMMVRGDLKNKALELRRR